VKLFVVGDEAAEWASGRDAGRELSCKIAQEPLVRCRQLKVSRNGPEDQ
jgi:hypothetical protein